MMKKNLLTLSLITLLTTACVPVVLVGAGAAAGATFARDSRTMQTISDDTNIEFEANQKLRADKMTDADTHISVTSFNYVVLLSGEVPSEAVRAKAESIAQSVPKVRRVYNMLQIAPVIGALQTTDDASIYANIRTRMLMTSNLNSSNFKWVVENKVVFLMGYANKEETQAALDVIRNSAGVTRVVNLVQIDNGFTLPPSNPNSSNASNNPALTNSTNASSHAAEAPGNNAVTTAAVPPPASITPTASSHP